jgi:hypothetical protein
MAKKKAAPAKEVPAKAAKEAPKAKPKLGEVLKSGIRSESVREVGRKSVARLKEKIDEIHVDKTKIKRGATLALRALGFFFILLAVILVGMLWAMPAQSRQIAEQLMDDRFVKVANGILNSNITRPGQVMASRGARAKHPVVIIPGIVSSGLEVWDGRECLGSHFRERIWVSSTKPSNCVCSEHAYRAQR